MRAQSDPETGEISRPGRCGGSRRAVVGTGFARLEEAGKGANSVIGVQFGAPTRLTFEPRPTAPLSIISLSLSLLSADDAHAVVQVIEPLQRIVWRRRVLAETGKFGH